MFPRTFIPLLLLAALIAPAGASAVAGEAASRLGIEARSEDRYIVGFHAVPDLAPGDDYLGARVVAIDDDLRFVLVVPEDPTVFQARVRLDENARYVEWDDPEFAKVNYVPNDPLYSNAGHYGSKKIGAQQAWDTTLGATSVKVAVIDSGLRKTHEEFAGSGRVLQGWDFVNGDNDPNDDCGHGTHVAGTIAATINNGKGIAGLAQVTILPIKGLSFNINPLAPCSGGVSGLANALKYAADQGAHFSSNSWGGGGSSAITDAINYAHARGVIHVAAAGNDGSCSNCVNEPWRANAAKVIIVSSTTSNDGFSSFSSQGPQVDIAAPGSSIISAYDSGDSSYATLSGTSMAAPHVTGAAALIKTLNPTWGYTDIDNRLKATAVDLGAAGVDDRFGHGRINAAAAVVSGPPANVPPVASFTHSTTGLTVHVNGASSSDSDGSVVSWSWDWGDGSPASSGSSTSHAYATSGAYTVTLTVTDDDGATASTSQVVTAMSAGPAQPLTNGQSVGATSGGAGTDQLYSIVVPTGTSQLQVVLDGETCAVTLCPAELDLYVRKGLPPTTSSYTCRPLLTGSDETCVTLNPGEDTWYVSVYVRSGASMAYDLVATYS